MNAVTVFRCAVWVIGAMVALGAAVIILSDRAHHAAVAEQLREWNAAELQSAKDHVEYDMDEIWTCVRLISLDSHVMRLGRESTDFLRAICEKVRPRRGPAAISIIERPGDVTPALITTIATWGKTDAVAAPDGTGPSEEANTAGLDHLGRFIQSPSPESLMSEPLALGGGHSGVVCSVPIHATGQVVGIVTATVSVETFSEILRGAGPENRLLLANERGTVLSFSNVPEEGRHRLQEEIASRGARAAFEAREPVSSAGPYTLMWSPVSTAGGQRWYVGLLYGQADYPHVYAGSGVWAVVGGVATVLLLGAVAALLCRVVAALIVARREADARAQALLASEERARQRQAELTHLARVSTVGEMATGLAHQINQPLYAIVNYLQACAGRLRSGQADPRELLEDVELATKQAERAGEIITRIRDFVRRRAPRPVPVDLNARVREAADWIAPEAQRRGVVVRLELEEHLPPVLAESVQIEQVLINLMRNSLEAIADATSARREVVLSTLRAKDGFVACVIHDTGPGLSSEATARIFEPFFSTKSGGMGMGLSISRAIIESYGGHLCKIPCGEAGRCCRTVESRDGRLCEVLDALGGSTFQFVLPGANGQSSGGREGEG